MSRPAARTPRNVCPFEVVVDTREQAPFTFAAIPADADERAKADGPDAILQIKTRRLALPVGDYSIFGLPHIVIERKSKEDLYGSIASTKRRTNFERRLSLMCSDYRVAAVVVEAEWSEILGDPPRFTEFSPKALYRTITAWRQRFPFVHWEMAPGRDAAEIMAFRMLDRAWSDAQKTDGGLATLAAMDRSNGWRRPFGYRGVATEGQPVLMTDDEIATTSEAVR